MTPRRAAIYCRISEDRDGTKLGVERQEEDCRVLAEHKGMEVVAVYADNDTTAYTGKPRPEYARLLEAVRGGDVDVVLAWHEDRLHRAPRELEDYIEACQPRGVPTYFAQAGELDLTTASGRMTARIRGAVSRQESEHKAERIARKHVQSARAGIWRGGARPFGWRLAHDERGRPAGAVLVEDEAQVVREACRVVLAGGSLGSIVADLNRRGVTTSRGNPWTYATLRQMLRRPKNAGLSELNGEIVGTMTDWPALVTEDTWRAVCAVLEEPSRRRSKSNRARWLMAGIALCGAEACGRPLKSATTGAGARKRTVYRCTAGGGGHVARAAPALDEHVEGVVLGVLARPDWREALTPPDRDTPDLEALRVEALALEKRLEEAADAYADGTITRAQLERITERTTGRLVEARDGLNAAHRGTLLGDFAAGTEPAAVWAALSLDRRRDIVRELLTVTVLPSGRRGKAYDPELIDFQWRTS